MLLAHVTREPMKHHEQGDSSISRRIGQLEKSAERESPTLYFHVLLFHRVLS